MRNYFFISVSLPVQAGIVPNKRSMNWWKLYIKRKTICLVFIRLLSESLNSSLFPRYSDIHEVPLISPCGFSHWVQSGFKEFSTYWPLENCQQWQQPGMLTCLTVYKGWAPHGLLDEQINPTSPSLILASLDQLPFGGQLKTQGSKLDLNMDKSGNTAAKINWGCSRLLCKQWKQKEKEYLGLWSLIGRQLSYVLKFNENSPRIALK